jgi:hypothetical protein
MGKNKYEASNGALFSQGEAQTVGEFLEKLTEERGGQITPQEIVVAAEDIQSPIHAYFEWDDKIAGAEYRKYQARRLINHVIIVNTEHQKAFYSIKVPIDENGKIGIKRAYMTQERTLKVEEYRQQTLDFAIEQITHWTKQYESFKELSKIHKAIKITMKELDVGNQLRKIEVEDTEV